MKVRDILTEAAVKLTQATCGYAPMRAVILEPEAFSRFLHEVNAPYGVGSINISMGIGAGCVTVFRGGSVGAMLVSEAGTREMELLRCAHRRGGSDLR